MSSNIHLVSLVYALPDMGNFRPYDARTGLKNANSHLLDPNVSAHVGRRLPIFSNEFKTPTDPACGLLIQFAPNDVYSRPTLSCRQEVFNNCIDLKGPPSANSVLPSPLNCRKSQFFTCIIIFSNVPSVHLCQLVERCHLHGEDLE